MKYSIEVPDGFLLKGLHLTRTDKGAELWWAYVQTAAPEYGKYCHFQGAQGFSIEDAIAKAHRALVASLEARRTAPAPKLADLGGLRIDLSKLRRPE